MPDRVAPAIATVGRSSAVRLYVTFFYIGGSAGAVLPGLAWDLRAGPRQSRFAYFTDPNGERRRIGLAAMSIATVASILDMKFRQFESVRLSDR
jgi:hypothetical protein